MNVRTTTIAGLLIATAMLFCCNMAKAQNQKGAMLGSCDAVGDFSEGLAAVWKDGKCGFINTKGELVLGWY